MPNTQEQLVTLFDTAYAAVPQLILQALGSGCPNEAMKLTQAALNAANALVALRNNP